VTFRKYVFDFQTHTIFERYARLQIWHRVVS